MRRLILRPCRPLRSRAAHVGLLSRRRLTKGQSAEAQPAVVQDRCTSRATSLVLAPRHRPANGKTRVLQASPG